MGGSTVAIAFLPGYAQVGWLAPVLLCVLRFGQGFGLGGEWGGAALLAVENAPPGWRGRFGMFPQLGAPVGFIFANGLFLLISLVWGGVMGNAAMQLLIALGLISGAIGGGALLLWIMEALAKLLIRYARLHFRLFDSANASL